jgi:hypothetical protein
MFAGALVGLATLGVFVLLTGLGWNFFTAVLSSTFGSLVGARWNFSHRDKQTPFSRFTLGELFVVISLFAMLLGIISEYLRAIH